MRADEVVGTGVDPTSRPAGEERMVVATISSEGWVDFPHVSEGVKLEVYDFGSETKTEELVRQELEEALERVRARTDADAEANANARGRVTAEENR